MDKFEISFQNYPNAMKAVVYNTQSFEKELIAIANQKKHDITLISNTLSLQTVQFAEGKDAVVITTKDDLTTAVVNELKKLDVKYIINRSTDTSNIDKIQASILGIKIAKITDLEPEKIAEGTIQILDNWQAKKCAGKACACAKPCRPKNT
jgi:lactate dehydrogenase-like 2-hydroxyacid dehydrogenase